MAARNRSSLSCHLNLYHISRLSNQLLLLVPMMMMKSPELYCRAAAAPPMPTITIMLYDVLKAVLSIPSIITNLHFALRQTKIRIRIMNKSYSKIRFIYYRQTINANQQSVSLQCFLRVSNLNNLKSENALS